MNTTTPTTPSDPTPEQLEAAARAGTQIVYITAGTVVCNNAKSYAQSLKAQAQRVPRRDAVAIARTARLGLGLR